MPSDTIVLAIVGITLTILIVYLFRRNQKDRRKFEQQLNQDYQKPGSHATAETDDNSI